MTIYLGEAEWRARAERHGRRTQDALRDVLFRRDRGIVHPIDDFLFHYYSLRPSQLMRWDPGIGIELRDAPDIGARQFYRTTNRATCFDTASFMARREKTVATARRLLKASRDAPGRFGCFGMHEWAMVYQLDPDETRHPYLQLRYSRAEIARIVESVGCRCSHFDAFRFFTAQAKPLNQFQPTRQSQDLLDQPGCLHVNMDLFKWAGKLAPAVSSELLFDTFELAREIRQVDMAASAYDVSPWGVEAIPVETAEGRAQYVAAQRDFSVRAVPLRVELLSVIDSLLAESEPRPAHH